MLCEGRGALANVATAWHGIQICRAVLRARGVMSPILATGWWREVRAATASGIRWDGRSRPRSSGDWRALNKMTVHVQELSAHRRGCELSTVSCHTSLRCMASGSCHQGGRSRPARQALCKTRLWQSFKKHNRASSQTHGCRSMPVLYY
jgi:hypothetical protein